MLYFVYLPVGLLSAVVLLYAGSGLMGALGVSLGWVGFLFGSSALPGLVLIALSVLVFLALGMMLALFRYPAHNTHSITVVFSLMALAVVLATVCAAVFVPPFLLVGAPLIPGVLFFLGTMLLFFMAFFRISLKSALEHRIMELLLCPGRAHEVVEILQQVFSLSSASGKFNIFRFQFRDGTSLFHKYLAEHARLVELHSKGKVSVLDVQTFLVNFLQLIKQQNGGMVTESDWSSLLQAISEGVYFGAQVPEKSMMIEQCVNLMTWPGRPDGEEDEKVDGGVLVRQMNRPTAESEAKIAIGERRSRRAFWTTHVEAAYFASQPMGGDEENKFVFNCIGDWTPGDVGSPLRMQQQRRVDQAVREREEREEIKEEVKEEVIEEEEVKEEVIEEEEIKEEVKEEVIEEEDIEEEDQDDQSFCRKFSLFTQGVTVSNDLANLVGWCENFKKMLREEDPNKVIFISANAEKLLLNQGDNLASSYQAVLDLDALPLGFYLERDDKRVTLCYSDNFRLFQKKHARRYLTHMRQDPAKQIMHVRHTYDTFNWNAKRAIQCIENVFSLTQEERQFIEVEHQEEMFCVDSHFFYGLSLIVKRCNDESVFHTALGYIMTIAKNGFFISYANSDKIMSIDPSDRETMDCLKRVANIRDENEKKWLKRFTPKSATVSFVESFSAVFYLLDFLRELGVDFNDNTDFESYLPFSLLREWVECVRLAARYGEEAAKLQWKYRPMHSLGLVYGCRKMRVWRYKYCSSNMLLDLGELGEESHKKYVNSKLKLLNIVSFDTVTLLQLQGVRSASALCVLRSSLSVQKENIVTALILRAVFFRYLASSCTVQKIHAYISLWQEVMGKETIDWYHDKLECFVPWTVNYTFLTSSTEDEQHANTIIERWSTLMKRLSPVSSLEQENQCEEKTEQKNQCNDHPFVAYEREHIESVLAQIGETTVISSEDIKKIETYGRALRSDVNSKTPERRVVYIRGELKGLRDRLSDNQSPALMRLRIIATLRELYFQYLLALGERPIWLRLEQLVSVLLLLEGGTLGNILTAEGKTTIIGFYAAISVFLGRRVDVFTHSNTLAEEGYNTFKRFFHELGIKVAPPDCDFFKKGLADIHYTTGENALFSDVLEELFPSEQQQTVRIIICAIKKKAGLLTKLQEAPTKELSVLDIFVKACPSFKRIGSSLDHYLRIALQQEKMCCGIADEVDAIFIDQYAGTDFYLSQSDEACQKGDQVCLFYLFLAFHQTRHKKYNSEEAKRRSMLEVVMQCYDTARCPEAYPYMDAFREKIQVSKKIYHSKEKLTQLVSYWLPFFKQAEKLENGKQYSMIPDSIGDYYVRIANPETNGRFSPISCSWEGVSTAIAISEWAKPNTQHRYKVAMPVSMKNIGYANYGQWAKRYQHFSGISGTAVMTREQERTNLLQSVIGATKLVKIPGARRPEGEELNFCFPRRRGPSPEQGPVTQYKRLYGLRDETEEDPSQLSITRVLSTKEAHYALLAKMLRDVRRDGRSSLMFFKTVQECEDFKKYWLHVGEGLNKFQLFYDIPSDENNTLLPPEGVAIDNASTPEWITLATNAFGRGTDFKKIDTVIFASPSHESTTMQGGARAARLYEKGVGVVYEVYRESQFSKWHISQNGYAPVYQNIKDYRQSLWEKQKEKINCEEVIGKFFYQAQHEFSELTTQVLLAFQEEQYEKGLDDEKEEKRVKNSLSTLWNRYYPRLEQARQKDMEEYTGQQPIVCKHLEEACRQWQLICQRALNNRCRDVDVLLNNNSTVSTVTSSIFDNEQDVSSDDVSPDSPTQIGNNIGV